MAISIISSPQLLQPVYNPIWFEVSSTNVAQQDFHYVFDIYVNNSFEERLRLLPRPVTTNCIFSPHSVLESYLEYDLLNKNLPNFTGVSTQENCILRYEIKFGEEYASSGATTGTTTYSGLTNVSGFTFNGVNSYEGVVDYDYTIYGISYVDRLFLTNAPNNEYVNENDRHTLSLINLNSGDTLSGSSKIPNLMDIVSYDSAGVATTNTLKITSYSGSAIDNKILHVGVGPYNLNNIPTGATYWTLGGTQPIIDNRTVYYTINLYEDDGFAFNFLTETKIYTIDSCTKYEPVRLMFLNALGGWDYFNFNLASKKNLDVAKTSYVKYLGKDYAKGDRGTTILSVDAKNKMSIVSNFITDEIAEWLQELICTKECYHLTSDGVRLPVILDTTSYAVKKRINDRIFNVGLDFTYAFNVNTARG